MTTPIQTPNIQNVPNFENIQFVDKEGNLTSQWKHILTQLFQYLKDNIGNEGFQIPNQTAANVAIIAANTDSQGNQTLLPGTLIYDSTNNLLKVALGPINSTVFHTVQTI